MANPEERSLQYWTKACEETSLRMISFEEIKKQREYLVKKKSADELTSDDYVKLSQKLSEIETAINEYVRTGEYPKTIYVYLETHNKCNNFLVELKKYLPADYKIKTSIHAGDVGKREITIDLDL